MAQATDRGTERAHSPGTAAAPGATGQPRAQFAGAHPTRTGARMSSELVAGTKRAGIRLDVLWSADGNCRAVLCPVGFSGVSVRQVDAAVRTARSQGIVGPITTSAMAESETDAFVDAGFTVAARLVLLRNEIATQQWSAPPKLRLVTLPRVRRRAQEWIRAGLHCDQAAFPTSKSFDGLSVREAQAATPRTHITFAVQGEGRPSPKTVVGWAISGRAGQRAYLQRLAVHPDHSGKGYGSALVVDALEWARWGRADVMAVNTNVGNERALSLYRRNGFVELDQGLQVLSLAPGEQKDASK